MKLCVCVCVCEEYCEGTTVDLWVVTVKGESIPMVHVMAI